MHGHTGKHGIQLIISPVRLFCTNQLNIALNSATFKYSIKHTGDVQRKLLEIQLALKNNTDYMMKLCKTLQHLTTQKFTMEIDKFLDMITDIDMVSGTKAYSRIQYIQDDIKKLYYDKDDNQNYKGTKFGMLNAVADYVSHAKIKQHDEYSNANAYINMIQNNKLLDKAYAVLAA